MNKRQRKKREKKFLQGRYLSFRKTWVEVMCAPYSLEKLKAVRDVYLEAFPGATTGRF